MKSTLERWHDAPFIGKTRPSPDGPAREGSHHVNSVLPAQSTSSSDQATPQTSAASGPGTHVPWPNTSSRFLLTRTQKTQRLNRADRPEHTSQRAIRGAPVGEHSPADAEVEGVRFEALVGAREVVPVELNRALIGHHLCRRTITTRSPRRSSVIWSRRIKVFCLPSTGSRRGTATWPQKPRSRAQPPSGTRSTKRCPEWSRHQAQRMHARMNAG